VLAMARIIVMAKRCSLYAGRIDHSDTNAKQSLTAGSAPAASQVHKFRNVAGIADEHGAGGELLERLRARDRTELAVG
jgi:hypothetical protein